MIKKDPIYILLAGGMDARGITNATGTYSPLMTGKSL